MPKPSAATKKRATRKQTSAATKKTSAATKKTSAAKKKTSAAKKKTSAAKKKTSAAKTKTSAAKKKTSARTKRPAAKKKAQAAKKTSTARTSPAKKAPTATKPPAAKASPWVTVEPPRSQARVPGSLYARVQAHTPKLLMGGSVRVPAEQLARVARLAWFADASAHPELRLDPPPGGALVPWSTPGVGVVVARDGDALRISFAVPEDHGALDRWALDGRPWLGEVGARLREQPDGAALELMAGSLSDADGPVLRCCGVLRRGTWEILSTYPPLARTRLEEALALSADAESGEGLSVDPAEADDLLSWAAEEPQLFGDSVLHGREGGVALERADPVLLATVARRLFRRRFAEVWPLAEE